MGPPVGDITLFGSKEVSWGPRWGRNSFGIKGGHLGPPVGYITIFGSKEVSWGQPIGDVTLFGSKEVN